MRLLVRFFGFLFAAGTVVFLVGIAAAAGLFWHFSKDLPDYSQLQDYEPPVMTRIHASDGALLAEYARERRLYLPIQAVPKLVTIAEAAYLAGLPKGPNNYNPFRQRDRAIERRNYVIDRMVEDQYIAPQEGERAKKEPLNVTPHPTGAHMFAAEYFAEEVRREIYERYGEKKLYEGGLSIRTTLDPKFQVMARRALTDGLVRFDEGQGWRGPVTKIDVSGDWGAKLAEIKSLADIAPWRLAVVLETSDQAARIGLQPFRDPAGTVSRERQVGIFALDGVKWAKPASERSKGGPKVGQI